MKIIGFKAFEGRNIYSHKKCIRMDVDLEGYSEIASNSIENFNEKLIEMIPILKEHRCGVDEKFGFVKRLYEGTYLAHVCEHIIIALQNLIGIDIVYGKAREVSGEIYYIIYQYKYKNTGIEAGKIALSIINAIIKNNEFNMEQNINRLKGILKEEQLGPSTLAIINEANTRGIPSIRLGEGSIFQLGYGSTSKTIEATISEKTSGLAIDMASDKLMTKNILNKYCIPIAEGEKVKNPVQMLMEAENIGYPVVLKPRYGNQGKCVFVNIKNEKELISSYKSIIKKYEDIIIEKHIIGKDYRVCVVDGKVVAAAERIPPFIIGDGKSKIIELINELNKDINRGEGHEKPLTKIKINEELVSYVCKQGYLLNNVLPKDIKLILRENANLSTGGMAIDYTEDICRENIEICERAAKAIGLNICGIDICCSDIRKPIDGAVIEINAAPGIRMHQFPSKGKTRNVAGAIVDMMFKSTEKQIPVISVTGTNGKTTTTRLIGHTLSLLGKRVGMTTTGGIYINNECIERGDTTGYNSATSILINKDVDVAVLETARGGIIKKGLAYDLADIGVITNITGDHLGIDGIDTMEDLAFVKSLVGEAVKDNGYAILNADDKFSMTILNRIKSNVILFSKQKQNPYLIKNIIEGGYAVYSDERNIYVKKGEETCPIVKIKDIKMTLEGKLDYNIENAMAAIAALVGLGVSNSVIRKGLTSFFGNEEFNPGRFNMYKFNNLTIVLDYGHNVEGYKAVLKGIKRIEHKRLVGIIGVPGDRSNESMSEIGKICGENFDKIYIKEDEDKRGRKEGEVSEILERGVIQTKISNKNISKILDEKLALKEAINNGKDGDLIIIFFEKYEPLLKIVKSYMDAENTNRNEIALA